MALQPAKVPLGLGVGLVFGMIEAGRIVFANPDGQYGPRLWISLADLGARATESALLGYGAALLAQRHTGARRRGLQIASTAWLAAVAVQFLWLGLSLLELSSGAHRVARWGTVGFYSWFAVVVLPPTGLAIAAMRRHRALAVASVVIAVMSDPPPFASHAMWSWLALGARGGELLQGGLSLLRFALIVALSITLAPPATLPEPGRAAIGLGRAVTGLRLRMIAVLIGTGTAWFALASHGRDTAELYKAALVAGAGLDAGAFGWLAFGLLDAVRDGELSRTRLAISGAASLWCGAVILAQTIFLYAATYGSNGWARSWADALALGVPLVELAGVAILAAELGSFVARHRARHRQDQLGNTDETGTFAGPGARHREEQLRRDTSGQLGWILLPMLASIAIQGWILPDIETPDRAELLVLVAGTASLLGLIALARLCGEASRALDGARGLPAARVVPVE